MNANTNINVLGGILDAMLANLVEMIDKRVEAKVVTLTERIERLETDLKAVEGQLYDLKDGTLNLDAVSNRTDEEYLKVTARLEDLEARLAGEQPDTTKFDLCILDCEEFRTAVIKIINTHTMGDEFLNPLIDALIDCDTFNDKVKEIAADQVGSSIEEAISDHCSDYDHDDIHETSDHEVDEEAVKDIIKEVLNNTTVTLKI
jgi:predicted nuclease with TOPRIM domain